MPSRSTNESEEIIVFPVPCLAVLHTSTYRSYLVCYRDLVPIAVPKNLGAVDNQCVVVTCGEATPP